MTKLSRLKKLSWRLLVCYTLIVVLISFADPAPKKYLTWWFWVAVGIIAVGQWVRIWAAGHLVKNKVLTITGPYAYVKNPLYLGTFLIMTGFSIMARGDPTRVWWQAHMNWFLLAFAVLVFIAYYAPFKQKREGDRLRKIFGDEWDRYDKAVPGYFPKLTKYAGSTERPWSWAATCANSEQWVPVAVVAGIAAILFTQRIQTFLSKLF